LSRYPRAVRSKFRQVVREASLVKGSLSAADDGESRFGKETTLTERGRRRLKELNDRRARGESV
jgi:hypothetical protein